MHQGNKLQWAMIAAVSVLLLLLLILFSYSHPHSDDFSYHGFLTQHSYWEASSLVYRFSGGRFFSTFLIFLSPLTQHSIEGYQWLTCALFILFVLSFYSCFYLFFEQITSKLQRLSLASLVLLLYLSFMPKLHEFSYWLCAEATYLTAASLWLWSLALHKLLWSPQYEQKPIMWLILCVVSVALIGCSEVGMMLNLIPLALYYWEQKRNKRPLHKGYWTNVILFFCLSILVASSSGNIGRHQLSPFSGNLLLAIGGGLFSAVEQLGQWLLVALPMALLYRIVFAPVIQKSITKVPFFFSCKPRQVLLWVFLYFTAMQILVVWMSGSVPEARFQNIQFLFVLLATLVYTQIAYQQAPPHAASHLQQWIVVYLLCLYIVIPNNFVHALLDVGLGTAKQFDQEQMHRYTQIANQEPDVVSVSPLRTKPFLLFYPTLSCSPVADSCDIPRTALAEYFGKKWIYEYPCSPEMPKLSIKELLKAKRAQHFGTSQIRENKHN